MTKPGVNNSSIPTPRCWLASFIVVSMSQGDNDDLILFTSLCVEAPRRAPPDAGRRLIMRRSFVALYFSHLF